MSKRSNSYFVPVRPTPPGISRRDTQRNDEPPPKRTRQSRSKVKSGCFTCKERHLKCDEQRPECERCQKSHLSCGGYKPAPGQSSRQQIQPRMASLSLYMPRQSIHDNEAEHRDFVMFCKWATEELSGFFVSEFWTRVVLQESRDTEPVRHAARALGALRKSLEAAPATNLKVNVIQDMDQSHHARALRHYGNAIGTLNQYCKSPTAQIRTALISCLLFICFETFQGTFPLIIQHTYGGLKLLRGHYIGKPGSKSWIPSTAPHESSSPTIGNISKSLKSGNGCNFVSKEDLMVLHVEEYLEREKVKAQIDPDATDVKSQITPDVLEHDADYNLEDNQLEPSNTHSHIARLIHTQDQQQSKNSIPIRQRLSPSYRGTPKHVKCSPDSAEVLGSEMPMVLAAAESPAIYTPHTEKAASGSPSLYVSTAAMERSSSATLSSTDSSPGPSTPKSSDSEFLPTAQPVAPSGTETTHNGHRILKNDINLEETLIQTFARLDGHGLFFGNFPAIPPLFWDFHETFHRPIPKSFSNFAEAQKCWDFLMDRALQFYRRTMFNRVHAPCNSAPAAEITRVHKQYRKLLSDFDRAFKPLLEAAIDANEVVLNAPALVISLYQKATPMLLAVVDCDSEMEFDKFTSSFAHITRTCRQLLQAKKRYQRTKTPRFTFEVGIIPPLHFTATRCRHPMLRRNATRLLFHCQRQEGMWDGVLTARIADWIMRAEEEGLGWPTWGQNLSSSMELFSEDVLSTPHSDRAAYPSPPMQNDDPGQFETAGQVAPSYSSRSLSRAPRPEWHDREWIVPEENRVQLTGTNFDIEKRFVEVRCQKALPSADGTREERRTVLSW